MSPRPLALLAPLLATSLLAACSLPQRLPEAAAPPAADRAAILSMAGEYEVEFSFRETVALAPGYTLKPPKIDHAHEWVTVVEDAPGHIVLQHILVVGEDQQVVKHWRQDWTWQPSTTWQFEGDRRWTRHPLPAEAAAGRWQQSVWQVDDSPRYFGIGRWTHEDGVSSWTSGDTARPLPRREYSTRDDYDILMAVNRHVITPQGWVHEQDNTKLALRDGDRRLLAREVGVNTYTRLAPGAHDFRKGRDYWSRTAPFWAQVRGWWRQRMAAAPTVTLRPTVDGQRMYRRMFNLAEAQPDASRGDIDAALRPFDLDNGDRS